MFMRAVEVLVLACKAICWILFRMHLDEAEIGRIRKVLSHGK